MRHRILTSLGVLGVAAGIASLISGGGTGHLAVAAATAASTKDKAPRTADGQPDLQGVWANNAATPVERPKAVADKPTLSDAELAALKKRAAELFSGDGDAGFGDSVYAAALADAKAFTSTDGKTGDYNHFWVADRWFDHRTSLVVDPPDGRIPPYTPEAQKRQDELAAHRQAHPADGPEDRSLLERCISSGLPNLLAGYNSNYEIFQIPGYVVISQEMIHDVRVIPLDGRPHVDKSVRLWLGDARGHWEGDTLVVDTTNFSAKSSFRGATENLHLVERFARISADTLQYEFTASDPATWTRPWTARLLLRSSPDRLFEYACHEGNTGLVGILAGHRAEENTAVGQRSSR